MPPVKSLDRISRIWASRVAAAGKEYEAGIDSPRRSWAEATKEATENYHSAIQQAISEGRFAKGVTKAGDERWRARAKSVGPRRWQEGVNGSLGRYEDGFAPYRKVIEDTVLPPRYPKGDPRNIDRVAIIADNLHKAKLQKGG
jgi:hypothetical protein